jgi:anaerobic ribonucleoside-triphosphate reductase activating protein
MKARIADYIDDSIVDGPGIRFVVFFQGCPFRCEGCHNPHTWDFAGGREVEIEDLLEIILANPLLSGVTFSGGEPFCQPEQLNHFIDLLRRNTNLNILVYTGHTYEQLLDKNDVLINLILDKIDYLIDGPFIRELKSLGLLFMGSSNQRFLDLNELRTKRSSS